MMRFISLQRQGVRKECHCTDPGPLWDIKPCQGAMEPRLHWQGQVVMPQSPQTQQTEAQSGKWSFPGYRGDSETQGRICLGCSLPYLSPHGSVPRPCSLVTVALMR